MPSRRTQSRTIRVKYLKRVEGEGALHIRLRDGELAELCLEIFEPPRFFESFCGAALQASPGSYGPHLRHLSSRLSDELGSCFGTALRRHN